MTDSEITVDLEATRSSRSSYMGVVTRSLRRYRKMEDHSPATYDLDNLADSLESLNTTERRCVKALDTIREEEMDPDRQEKDEDSGEMFRENVQATRTLLKRFMALKTSHELAVELRSSLEDLETSKSRDPGKDQSIALTSPTTDLDDLQKILRTSTINPDHELRRDAADFRTRLNTLTSEDRIIPTPGFSFTPASSFKKKTVALPKITLPTFHGDLMSWASFWSQFKSAVDSNTDLTPLNKLAYLGRQSKIKPPALSSSAEPRQTGSTMRWSRYSMNALIAVGKYTPNTAKTFSHWETSRTPSQRSTS